MSTLQTDRIPFYKQRSFGEKISASFDFLKENWKVMLKYMTYLILPLCLIQALSLNLFMNSYLRSAMEGSLNMASYTNNMGLIGYYFFTIFFSIIASWLIFSLVYALIRLYNERENRLVNVAFAEIKPLLFRNLKRLFVLCLVCSLLVTLTALVMGLLVALTPFTLILTLPALMAFVVALFMWMPVHLFERNGVFISLSKGLRLGFLTWGGVFGILFVMGIIASILQGVMIMPWYITTVVSAIFSLSGGETDLAPQPVYYTFLTYLLAVLGIYGSYITSVFFILGLSYQYAHATEKLDSITVESDIDNFENL